MMRFGTFCSGIAAPEVAWTRLGWEPQWFSEIEPFPCAVLAHHYPGVPNLGDMENISGEQLRGTVDVVCAGTPCQSFSVAGLRGGMDDPRGNLALVFLRLVDAIRPAWVVWENVPGVLSSNDGRDFGAFIGGLGQLGYGFAYRVLDAQYVGVPQRRRRVFVVGCLGDWRGAAAVLFERHSLSGNPPPSREAGERIAASLTRGADSSGAGGYAGRRREDDYNLVAGSLRTQDSFDQVGDESKLIVTHSLRADGFDASEDGTGRGTPIIPIDMRQASRGATMTNNRGDDVCSGGAPGTGIGEAGDPAPSVSQSHPPAVAYSETGKGWWSEGMTGVRAEPGGTPSHVVAFGISSDAVDRSGEGDGSAAERSGLGIVPDAAPALRARRNNAVAYINPRIIRNSQTSNQVGIKDGSVSDTLSTDGPGAIAFAQNTRDEVRQIGGDGQIAGALGSNEGVKQRTYIAQEVSHAHVQLREVRREADGGAGSRGDSEGAGVDDPLPELHPVSFQTRIGRNGRSQPDETCPTLQGAGAGATSDMRPCVASGMAVRRLTPRECERLQGFPDDYTLIPFRGKPAADGPRYRAIGNSMAVPVLEWIGRRIAAVEHVLFSPEVA